MDTLLSVGETSIKPFPQTLTDPRDHSLVIHCDEQNQRLFLCQGILYLWE